MSLGGQDHATTEEPDRPVAARDVYEAELKEVRQRRKVAKPDAPVGDVRQNLIGLALSGGGVRSGAFCLGLLQALHRRGILPLIDYLSTVSGGGYAGAYLSSAALRNPAASDPRPHRGNGRPAADAPDDGDCFALAPGDGDCQPPRMMRFIYGGHYLRKTWTFFNRYLIGLLLIWTVALSGLIAAAALIAWLFRHLDWPGVRERIAVLKFDSDLRLALFPSFILLLLWCAAWAISYWRKGSQAAGQVAQWLFYVLVATTLVAIAAVLGSGEIDLAWASTEQGTETEAVTWVRTTLWSALYAVIGACLLPYLSPQRLMQSGTSPTSRPAERYIYWAATRALVFGVPLLLIASLAQENISSFNERRSAQLVIADLSPEERQPNSPFWTAVQQDVGRSFLWDAKMNDALQNLQRTHAAALDSRIDPAESSTESALIGRFDRDEAEIPFYKRWWSLVPLAGNAVFGTGADDRNPLRRMAHASAAERAARDDLIHLLNGRLNDPSFSAHIPERPTLAELHNPAIDGAENERRISEITRRRRIAEAAAAAYRDEVRHARETAARAGVGEVRPTAATGARKNEMIEANRRLLDAWYGNRMRDRSVVFSSVVLAADQKFRLTCFYWALGIFLLSSLLVDLNATSWHYFYGHHMAQNWIDEVPGLRRDIPLAQLETTQHGRPYHLISGSLHLVGKRDKPPGDTARDHFLFSRLYCGSERTGYEATERFSDGGFTLADAVAVSGAAVSPVQTNNPLTRALLVLGNVRLGQWVENPAYRPRGPRWSRTLADAWPITPFRFLLGLFHVAEKRPHCFVTDGGHYENLGIEPLLMRRCRLILAADAGQDENFEFADLTKLVRWARIRHGIEIRFPRDAEGKLLGPLTPDKPGAFPARHFVVAQIRYPKTDDHPVTEGWLVYMKSSMTGDEPLDLVRYQAANPTFPHDSTADQFYEPERFESYRQLGFHIADHTLGRLGSDPSRRVAALSSEEFIETVGTGGPPHRAGDADQPASTAPPVADAASPQAAMSGDGNTPPADEVAAWTRVLADPDSDSPERHAAAEKLAAPAVPCAASISALVPALGDADDFFASQIRQLLVSVASRCLPTFRRESERQTEPAICARLAEVMEEIFAHQTAADPAEVEPLVDLLIRWLNAADRRVWTSAVEALGQLMGHSAQRDRIVQAINDLCDKRGTDKVYEVVTRVAWDAETVAALRGAGWYHRWNPRGRRRRAK